MILITGKVCNITCEPTFSPSFEDSRIKHASHIKSKNNISLVHDKIETEKYIAATMNAEREFQQKWKFLLTI